MNFFSCKDNFFLPLSRELGRLPRPLSLLPLLRGVPLPLPEPREPRVPADDLLDPRGVLNGVGLLDRSRKREEAEDFLLLFLLGWLEFLELLL